MKKVNKPLIRLKRQRVCVRARARGCFDSRKLTMCKRKQTKMELQSTRIELILLTYHTTKWTHCLQIHLSHHPYLDLTSKGW